MKVLVVEDEVKVAEVLKRGLEEAGYLAEIAYDGQVGLQRAQSGEFDLLILDINLPHINGIELCTRLRKTDIYTPVLMLTALGMTEDVVAGLEAGADDYLTKPFRFTELYARVKALVRRSKIAKEANTVVEEEEEDIFKLDDLEIDYNTKEVKRGGQLIQLTAREYALLEYLSHHAGKVCSRAAIAQSVWRLDFETGTNFIDVYVNYLRNKIDKPFANKLIHTHTGFGYILRNIGS